MATAKLKRLRPGQLDRLVLDYIKAHHKEGLGGRSAGAVANCLTRLAEDGEVRQAKRTPRAYALK
jgi:hypothetical protein